MVFCHHITKYVDILLLSETKLDDSFPTAQSLLNGFCKPFRLDRSSNGGGILLYVRDGIPSGLLTDYKIKDNLELFFVEVNIRKKKWLLGCSYNPHKNISNHLHHLNKGLDLYLKSFDNILIMGDLNFEVSENCLNGFCNVTSLKTLNRGPTCFKNPNNPSCIDLFLSNRQQSFQQTCAIETGISDFHKMVVTVMKTHYKKQKAKTIQYRNYKHFHEQSFNFELNSEFLKIDINNAELKELNEFFLKVLDKHAPRKQKYIRANNSNYITRALRKEIMHRSRLRNKFLRERTKESKVAYNKQRNICVSLLRKSKRDYFANLDTKIMKD